MVERYPSFIYGLYKFNIVYLEDFSLKSFSNVSKNFGTFARPFLNKCVYVSNVSVVSE